MLPYHTDFEDLSDESKDSAADRMPKARQHTVRARLFAGKQVLSFWGTLPRPEKLHQLRKQPLAYGTVFEH
jgi:hypothetical protein